MKIFCIVRFSSIIQAALEQQRIQLQVGGSGANVSKISPNREKFSGKLGENPRHWIFTMDTAFKDVLWSSAQLSSRFTTKTI